MGNLNQQPVKEITVQQLENLIEKNQDFQLIDVREVHEHKVANIGGKLIPLGEVYFNLAEIEKDKAVIIYCRSGRRSEDAVRILEEATGHARLYNLKGGILAWAEEIDQSVTVEP